jgi:pimeloyl-ACP methyl ester carboxylesterase
LFQLKGDNPRARELLDAMLARYRGEDLLQPADAPAENWQSPGLGSIRVPALVLGGALDSQSRQSAADRIARALPRAQREVVPDAGHLANLDNPESYNELLLRFLRRHAGASPSHHP